MQGDMQRRLGGWLGNLVLIATVGGCGIFWTSQGADDAPVALVDGDSRLVVEDTVEDEPSTVTVPDAGPFTVVAAEAEGGTVLIEPSASSFERDEFVTITAVPTPGSRFAGWTGDLAGNPNEVVVRMSADVQATPVFTSDATVTVQAVGGGRVVADVPLTGLSIGDTITLTAVPDEGRQLQSWIAEPAAAPGWWSTEWDYRVPIAVTTPAATNNAIAAVELDFRTMLDSLGDEVDFDPDSIRVIEVDAGGAIVSSIVAFEFQPSVDESTGTLRILLEGESQAGQIRGFHVYFDTVFGGHVAVAPTERVSVTPDEVWESLSMIRIEAGESTYYFDPRGGGLAAMIDADGNDWISWSTASRADGRFRGVPNAVFPDGLMHPGEGGSTTVVSWAGALTTELVVETDDGLWRATWRFSEHAVSMTMDVADGPYWFLYEGTPGGTLDLDTDIVVRSSGESTTAATAWSADLAGAEWLAVVDPALERSILLTNHQDDTAIDSYDHLETMTVLGFGRSRTEPLLTAAPATYSIEFVDSIAAPDLAAASGLTRGAANAVVGSAETYETGVVADEILTVTLAGDMSVQAVFGAG